MIQIIVKDYCYCTSIIERSSPYSIINEESRIRLNPGLNNISSFKYGFYFDLFCNTEDIILINLRDYDTSNIIDMSVMFAACPIHHIKLNNFNTNNVISMHGMFCGCSKLEKLDLSSFDTHNVTNISSMFLGCRSLTELDLSSFDTSNVTNMTDMFYGCSKLSKIKCKQSFKDWCITNKRTIRLSDTMVYGTVGAVGSGSNWDNKKG